MELATLFCLNFIDHMFNPICSAYLEISLLVLCRCLELDKTKTIVSANSRPSKIDVMVTNISLRLLQNVFRMTQYIAIRNSNGDMMHPSLTPIVMLNQLLHLLSSITLQVKLLYKALTILISMSEHPYAESIFHRL